MKVEFKNLQDKFQILEHVIRKSSIQSHRCENSQEKNETDFLQARLLLKKFDDETLNFSVSYYGKNNEFLGLDTAEELFLTRSKDRSVAISTPLDIPDKVERVIVRFIFEDEINADNGFYEILFKITLAMFVAWLGLSLFKSFSSLLS